MSKYKKKILTFFVVLIVFLSGLLTERFQIDNRFINYIENSYDKFSRYLYGFFSNEEILIKLEKREFDKMVDIRKKSLKQTKLTKDLEKWSSGKMIFDNQIRNIQIRLKGVFSDHWADSEQWSFKVKIK